MIPGLFLDAQLKLDRCPYCSIANPQLPTVWETKTTNAEGHSSRTWRIYKCVTCGGLVSASSTGVGDSVCDLYPARLPLDPTIPERARTYLHQATESLHAPAGCIMLTGSAVDAMLKNKGYTKGSLNTRIDEAAKAHLITNDMAAWAHDIRLDANDERHADEAAPLPDQADARKCLDFALALAQFLFVLPARVERGRKDAAPTPASTREPQGAHPSHMATPFFRPIGD
jgi:hypothetical protein